MTVNRHGTADVTQVSVEIDLGKSGNIIEKSCRAGSSQPHAKGLLPFGSRNYW